MMPVLGAALSPDEVCTLAADPRRRLDLVVVRGRRAFWLVVPVLDVCDPISAIEASNGSEELLDVCLVDREQTLADPARRPEIVNATLLMFEAVAHQAKDLPELEAIVKAIRDTRAETTRRALADLERERQIEAQELADLERMFAEDPRPGSL